MLNRTCYDFIEVLSSNAPVPGGGGASALVASIGTALGTMVGNLTTGKKTYAANEEAIQELLGRSAELTKELEKMVNGDAEAFAPLSDAYRLSTGTPEEKAAKEAAIQAALPAAAGAPLKIAKLSVEALHMLDGYSRLGSRLSVSDAGTGAAFCHASLRGAALNVRINLKLIKDEELKQSLTAELESYMKEGLELADKIYDYVESECM